MHELLLRRLFMIPSNEQPRQYTEVAEGQSQRLRRYNQMICEFGNLRSFDDDTQRFTLIVIPVDAAST